MPKISVIVPVYNVEKYLHQCVDSILAQTFTDFELILVDDGSPDSSGAICDEYAGKDSRITVIHKENGGVSSARNAGLDWVYENSNSEYIAFIDSDDWINVRYVEFFTRFIKKREIENLEKPDIIFTLPNIYDTTTKLMLPWHNKKLYNEIFEIAKRKDDKLLNVITNPEIYALETNSCYKIYRTEFLKENNFKYPLGLTWEDLTVHFLLLHKAKSCTALPEIGFYYRVNTDIQVTGSTGKSRLDMITTFYRLLDLQNKENFNTIEKAYIIRLLILYSLWTLYVINLDYIDAFLHELHKIFKKLKKQDIQYYLKNICDKSRIEYERAYISCVLSSHYILLNDYFTRQNAIRRHYPLMTIIRKAVSKLKRVIKEKGIKYTIKKIIKLIIRF